MPAKKSISPLEQPAWDTRLGSVDTRDVVARVEVATPATTTDFLANTIKFGIVDAQPRAIGLSVAKTK